MSPKIVIALIVCFIITFFGIFNVNLVNINLFGLKVVQLPLSFFVFLVFLIGVLFASIMSLFDQIQKTKMNKKLKREVIDFKIKFEELQEHIKKQKRDSESRIEQEKQEKAPKQANIETRDFKFNEDKTKKSPFLGVVNPHEANEEKLTPELREFALKRIQNG